MILPGRSRCGGGEEWEGIVVAGNGGSGSRLRRTAGWLGTHPTPRTGWNWAIWIAAVLVLAAIGSGHKQTPSDTADVAKTASTPTSSTTTTTGGTGAASSTTATVQAAATTASRAATTATSHPAASTGGVVVLADGAVLPNRARTPGAVNPAVTQANIGSTICVSGYTATIRPPSSYTTGLKIRQLASGYAYHGDTNTADYEEDHLISLELGGSPTAEANLWPEPYAGKDGARTKDQIENKLHALVCAHTITLTTAQHAIASNWVSAYDHYLGTPAPPAPPPSTPAPAPAPTTAAPIQHGCTTTTSGSCIRAGQFCKKALYGSTGYDATGRALRCTGDSSHPHWE